MFKKILTAACLFLTMIVPQASASCDLSDAHVGQLAQRDLDTIYAYNPLGLKEPTLAVSGEKGRSYYGEQLGSLITIFPKSFDDAYCDQYFDGLTPNVAQVISHEYTHYLDGKLSLSRKIGEAAFSEDTAHLGEHVFDDLVWHAGYFTQMSSLSAQKKYGKLLQIIAIPAN